jgi:beta-phosphoglucomutase-like phosphatase (HAD superfamily)
MSGIRAVIFDFNGVLVDDESVHFELFREVLAQEEVVITDRDYHERYLGFDDRKCLETALIDAGKTADRALVDQLIARKARRYIEVAERGLRFFPAAETTLKATAIRWPVAICSGALRPEIEYALTRLGCRDKVRAIVSAEDTEKCKPDPTSYRLTLEALRAAAADDRVQGLKATDRSEIPLDAFHCLVIEDSLAGIAAAKGAGMRAVGVSNTYTAAELRTAGADDVIDGLTTLTTDWIERRFSS